MKLGSAADSKASEKTEANAVEGSDKNALDDDMFVVDESEKMGTVTVMKADGTRLPFKCNPAKHTVNDLFRFVKRSDASGRDFALLGGYPVKPLSPSPTTILAADLSGAMVRQRYV